MIDDEIIEVVSALKANDKTMKDSGISDNLWGKAVECIKFLQFENAELTIKNEVLVHDIENLTWREKARMEFARLESENAAMHEKLEKMVELPCKVGDSAYYIQNDKIYYGTVVCLCFDSSGVNKISVELPLLDISEYMPSSQCIEKREVGKTLFFTIAEAKSYLAELKGEKE